MLSMLAVVLFDMAFLAPPLAVAIGVVMLALPSAAKKAAPQITAHAA